MLYQTTEVLRALSEKPENTRNFCMVAHVDHGKTTLSDYLVASNGILSPQLAGEVRLLDSRPDEQERCITMKASSIALHHVFEKAHHVLNLVDSPGHIDFSCEVSTAMRLCDGAIVIVDVVDGVTQQTYSMLRHSYAEGLDMVLVLNKIDLLITTQQFTAEEAYFRMRSLIETCNATLAAYANQMRIQEIGQDMERDDPSDDVWFDPCKGNVLFCSCHDGWAFGVERFVSLYKDKVPIPNLREALWGSNYLDAKAKTASPVPKKEGQSVMAVQLMLEPIWQLYAAFLEGDDDDAQRVKMSAKLGIDEKAWNNPRSDNAAKLKSLLSHWLPLAKCVLDAVCTNVDSPVEAQRRRLPSLIPELADTPAPIKEALLSCDPSRESPCIVYICKLIDTQYLVGRVVGAVENADDAFIGFARVYCGRLRAGHKFYVFSDNQVVEACVSKVFLFRGAGLEETTEVPAGCLCGVGGLTPYIVKYATLSSEPGAKPFRPLVLPSTSIVRLSVFPKDPKNLSQLESGLRLLYKVDPQVDVSVLATGEHVIGTAGEVHAERCIKDLIDTFARVDILASEPLVSFRESITGNVNAKPKPHTATVMDGAFSITLYAKVLPQEVLAIMKDDERNNGNNPQVVRAVAAALKEHKRFASEMKRGMVAWGPTKSGFLGTVLLTDFDEDDENAESRVATLAEWRESIKSGFEAAAESGPMAMEPLFGVAFVITDVFVDPDAGLSGGMVLPCVRDACRAAMELHPRRLVEPVYECIVYSSGSTQGKIYGSLSRRRSEVLEEVPNEGSDLFYIRCWLPAAEAFGLQDELRVQTQGASTASLRMSHWEYIDADPYFVPTTKEEIEEHGAEVATKNIAEQLLERVKRRKGLYRERVVESAEKQKFSLKGA